MPITGLKLYHYWRSSSSWRVRAALALKKIPYESIHTGLLNGENSTDSYFAMNPAGAVPTLVTEDGVITESLAMIQYLEEKNPSPTILPGSSYERARILALAETINSGTHPIQNLPVLQYLSSDLTVQKKWAQYWIRSGLEIYEALLNGNSNYSNGNSVTLADLCLIPQCYNALRYEVELSDFPKIKQINDHCLTLDCFTSSHPDRFKPID